MKEFVPHTGLSYGTVDTILRRGINNASVNNVIKICQALKISTDELAHGKIVPIKDKHRHNFTLEEMDDILSFYRANFDEFKKVTIGGKPMTKEDAELIMDTLEITTELIKRRQK